MGQFRMSVKPMPIYAPPSLNGLLHSAVGEIFDRDAARYVGWCWRRQGQHWTKPPFHVTGAGTIALASTTDAHTWMKLEAAYLAWYQRKFDGLGIVLLDEPVGLRRVDLDGCRDPQTGVVCEPALAIAAALDSLTTISVSGTGLAIWTIGPPFGEQHRYKTNQPDWPRVCDKEPALELLNSHCYSAVGLLPLAR